MPTITIMGLAACSCTSTPTTTSNPTPSPAGPTAANVQAYANPITESMLVSLNNNDYADFSAQEPSPSVSYIAYYTDDPFRVRGTTSFNSSQKVAGLFFNSPKINGQ